MALSTIKSLASKGTTGITSLSNPRSSLQFSTTQPGETKSAPGVTVGANQQGTWKPGTGVTNAVNNTGTALQNKSDRTSQVAGVLSDLGFNNLSTMAQNKANRQNTVGQNMETWQPGQVVNNLTDKAKTGVNDAVGGVIDTLYNGADTARTRADEGLYGEDGIAGVEYDAWGNAVNGINTNTNVTTGLNPGGESMGGQFYSGYEKTAMDKTKDLMNAKDTAGSDISNIKSQISGDKSNLESTLEDMYTAAASGNLTDAQSEYYQNAVKEYDTQAEKDLQTTKENLAGQGALWGGRQDQAVSDLMSEYNDKKNTLLSELQKNNAESASSFLNNQKTNDTQLTNIASNALNNANTTASAATNQALGHTQAAATDQNAKLGLQLQEELARIDNEEDKADMLGDLTKTKVNSNQTERGLVNSNLNTTANTANSLIATLLSNIQKNKGSDSNSTISTLASLLA